MTTQTQEEQAKAGLASCNPFDKVFGRRRGGIPAALAVFGCMVAGAVGILKALSMDSPVGVLTCLAASVAAFGLVIYIRFRQD